VFAPWSRVRQTGDSTLPLLVPRLAPYDVCACVGCDGASVKVIHRTYEMAEKRLILLQVQCCVVAASVSGGRHEDLLASRHGDRGCDGRIQHCTHT
jgi:hypothetical protein